MITRKTFLTAAALAGLTAAFASQAKAQSSGELVPLTIDAIVEGGTGFEVGNSIDDRTTYVFFDPQCVHCGALWEAAKPLLLQMKFVWMPVGLLNKRSVPQGAAILESGVPEEAMNEHESLWKARKGGIYAPDEASGQAADAIAENTALFRSFGLTTVPVTVAVNAAGQPVTATGSRTTEALARLLELDYVSSQ